MIENSTHTAPRDHEAPRMSHFTMTRAADKKRSPHRDDLNIQVVTCRPVTQDYVNELAAFITRVEASPVPRDPFSYYSKVPK